MKRAILLLLVVAIAGAIWWAQRPRPQTLVLTGTVDGNEVVVGSKITGRIVSLAVEDGQWVKAGDLIAVLDQDELRADQGAAGHAIAQARANAQQSVAQTELLQQTLPTKVRQAEAQVAANPSAIAAGAGASRAVPSPASAGAGASGADTGGGGQVSGQLQPHPAAGRKGHQPAAGPGHAPKPISTPPRPTNGRRKPGRRRLRRAVAAAQAGAEAIQRSVAAAQAALADAQQEQKASPRPTAADRRDARGRGAGRSQCRRRGGALRPDADLRAGQRHCDAARGATRRSGEPRQSDRHALRLELDLGGCRRRGNLRRSDRDGADSCVCACPPAPRSAVR